MKKRIIVVSAPSGGGKSIVANHILEHYKNVQFSISATTRKMRKGEVNGKHYYFLSKEEFEEKIKANEFVEYESIFSNYYGTLCSEIELAFEKQKQILFDIDVKGAYSIKKHYPEDTLLIFLKPPSLEVLKNRLINRKTETEEQLEKRIARAKMEIEMSADFDFVIVNDVLDETLKQVDDILSKFL